jgi:flagellar basal body-associated protein FliL
MFILIAVFLVTCSALGFTVFATLMATIPEKKKERNDQAIRWYVQFFNIYPENRWLLLETTSTGYVLKWRDRTEFFTFEDSQNAVRFIESLK